MAEFKNGFENWKPWHKIAVGIAFGFLALVIIVVAFAPTENPSEQTAGFSSDREKAAAAQSSEIDLAAKKQDILLYWKAMTANITPCDEANSAAVDSLQKLDDIGIYAAFELAKAAENRCAETWQGFNKLNAPDSIGEKQVEMLEKATDDCGTAYFTRKESLETLQTALDGDLRPSIVQSYREDSQFAQDAALSCISTVMSIAMQNGASAEELKLD